MEYPSSKPLTQDELDLVWKYRAYLCSQRKALPKFLRSVIDWHGAQSSGELKEALELLANWERIDMYDALELLSPDFQHPAVRRYAVAVLDTAQDRVRHMHFSLRLRLRTILFTVRWPAFSFCYTRTLSCTST